MGETIDFPYNNRMFFQKAINSLENLDFETALEYVEKIYETDKSPWINYTYTTILFNLDRNEEALEIANQQKDEYLKNERYRLLYTTLLIKNQVFLEAEVIIQDSLNADETKHYEEWVQEEDELTKERDSIEQNIIMQKHEAKNNLLNIGDYSPTEQHEVIHKSNILDLNDLQEVAQQIFMSPYISMLSKRAFLEILVKKGDDNTYIFSWFNQQKEVTPVQLSLFEDNYIVKHLDELLEDKCYKLPDIIEMVKMEVINDLLLLYPFIEEVITDVDHWLDHYINHFDVNNILEVDTTSQTQQQMMSDKYIKQLDMIAHRQSNR